MTEQHEPSAGSDLLSLTEVAQQLEVHYMTAYRYVRLGMLPAVQQGRAWKIRPEDLAAFVENPPSSTERGTAQWGERLLSRMLDSDASGAWSVVEAALASGMSPSEAYEQLLVPALRSVGELWVAGDIGVADEHAASRVATRITSRLSPLMARRGVTRGTIVLGSTQTELHGLATTIAADLFRAGHFKVVDLGVNLPSESLAAAVADQHDVLAVAVSVTTPGQDVEIARSVAAVKEVSDSVVVVGGAGTDETGALASGADGYARTASEAMAIFEETRAAL